VKQALSNPTLLVYLVPNVPTSVITHASDVAANAVLQQYINELWCPLSFFLTNLLPAETRYSTSVHKLLAIYRSIRHFRYFLEGRDFA